MNRYNNTPAVLQLYYRLETDQQYLLDAVEKATGTSTRFEGKIYEETARIRLELQHKTPYRLRARLGRLLDNGGSSGIIGLEKPADEALEKLVNNALSKRRFSIKETSNPTFKRIEKKPWYARLGVFG